MEADTSWSKYSDRLKIPKLNRLLFRFLDGESLIGKKLLCKFKFRKIQIKVLNSILQVCAITK
ncbi:MAG: hypothetical protein ACK56F_10685, partial [bacterium]